MWKMIALPHQSHAFLVLFAINQALLGGTLKTGHQQSASLAEHETHQSQSLKLNSNCHQLWQLDSTTFDHLCMFDVARLKA
eukprot:m.332354 g.332354  ORF g.332354 m.332354 type:complete len:81 (-) comp16935_c0_seq1:111-353(-)